MYAALCSAFSVGCFALALAGCQTAPPPPWFGPAAFIPLGVSAPYLTPT